MYLESYPGVDDSCTVYCGKQRPYMIYDGDKFCVTDATEKGRWQYVDFSAGGIHVKDPEGITTTVVPDNSC